MNQNTLRTATILALSTALISGMANFVNKFAVAALKDPILFTTLKNSLVAVFLVGVVLMFGQMKEIRALGRRQWLKLFLIGAVGGALPFALFFTGLAQTSAVAGALIHKTLFLWVALLAIPFLKERMVAWQWLGIGLVFAGNIFVGGFNGFKFNEGELMILLATILWAVENVIAKKALSDISAATVGAARMTIGAILLAGYIYFFGGGFGPVVYLSAVQWSWTFVAAALLAGYVITWYSALSKAPATYVATLLVPATLVTNVLSAAFITHVISGRDLFSAIFYTAGITLIIFFAKKSSVSQSPLITPN